ncbi:MAG: hypothetical protein WDN01_16885 [Rhizomicrobium sp.]
MLRHAAQPPHEADSNLRAELSTKIASAQFDVENRLSELRGALSTGAVGSAVISATTQLQGLSQLQRRIASADAATLTAIRNEVAACVAATQAFVRQEQADKAAGAAQAALAQASDAARSAVTDFERDFYGRRIFDPYLKFASAEDEDGYRHREEERRLAIEKALAEGTPEGNLRANQLAIDQLKDAGAHGADRSPDYASRLTGLQNARDQLIAASPPAKEGKPPAVSPPGPANAASPDATSSVPPDVVAVFRAAQLAGGDNARQGHGVSAAAVAQADIPLRG